MNKELIEEVLEFIGIIENGTEEMCPDCSGSPNYGDRHKPDCKLIALRKKLEVLNE